MSDYFRRVYREGNKLRSVHIGSLKDPLTQVLLRRHKLTRAFAKAHREENEKLQRWLATIDVAMDRYAKQLNGLLKVWLRVQRISVCRDGSWLIKRQRKRKGEAVPVNMTRSDFDELVILAEKGNEQAITSLCQLMTEDRETWRPFGDLSRLVQKQLLSSITGAAASGNAIAITSLEVNLDELRERLRRGISDPLRDIAIDQIIMAHLDVHRQALVVAEPDESRTTVNHNDQRMKRAQARFQSALDFLAKIDRSLGLHLKPVEPNEEGASLSPKRSEGPSVPASKVRPEASTSKQVPRVVKNHIPHS